MDRALAAFLTIVFAIAIAFRDGTTWAQGCSGWRSSQVSSGPASLQAAAWSGGQFWAFGSTAYGSATGVGWTALGAGPPMELVQVCRFGDTLVAVGHYLAVATSADGLHWTIRNSTEGGRPSEALNDVASNGSTWIAVGFEPTESMGAYGYAVALASSDLEHWSPVTLPPSDASREELDGIVWTGSRFVAVGKAGYGGVAYASADGLSWTRISGPGGSAVAWNGRELVAVGGYVLVSGAWVPVAWRSADGTEWRSTPVNPDYVLAAVTWDGARFVAVGRTSAYPPEAVILTSPDGASWGANQTNEAENLVAVASHLGATVAVGLNGTILAQTCTVGEPVYLPAAAHLSGLNGSTWRTDLEVHNAGSTQADYTIDLLARDADNTAPQGRSFTLAPGTSARYPDALASLFGYTGAATLRITPYGGPLITGARIYDAAATGTFGQYVEGVAEGAAIGFGTTARIIGLSQWADRASGFRTNIGLVSASASAMTVEVELHRGDGTLLGTRPYALRPYESIQRNEIFREVTAEAMDEGYAIVRTTTESGEFFAYATVIDNLTNDPIYIRAR